MLHFSVGSKVNNIDTASNISLLYQRLQLFFSCGACVCVWAIARACTMSKCFCFTPQWNYGNFAGVDINFIFINWMLVCLSVCVWVFGFANLFLTSYANLITRTSHSSTASSNCVSTSPTRNFSSSSTITCSSWNRRNTRERESSGPSLILAWTCKLALIWLRR